MEAISMYIVVFLLILTFSLVFSFIVDDYMVDHIMKRSSMKINQYDVGILMFSGFVFAYSLNDFINYLEVGISKWITASCFSVLVQVCALPIILKKRSCVNNDCEKKRMLQGILMLHLLAILSIYLGILCK